MRGSAVLLLSLVAIATGCSETETLDLPKGKLQGKIAYKGKVVPHALVIVSAESGMGGQGFADQAGKYLIENCPVGTVSIGINTDAGRGNMMSEVMSANMQGKKPPIFVDVPKKYFDPSSSGIGTTLSDSEDINSFDIELK